MSCCNEARSCCEEMIQKDQNLKPDHCPAKWDGYMCWDSAKANTTNYKTCPKMTYFASRLKPTPCRSEIASKQCMPDSQWKRIRKSDCDNRTANCYEEYTNYFPCSTPGATIKLSFIRVSIGFHFVSLLLTVIGVTLLYMFPLKKLPQLRTTHINFHLSLIFTSICSLCVHKFIKEEHYEFNSMIEKK